MTVSSPDRVTRTISRSASAGVEAVERTSLCDVMRPPGLQLPGSYLPRVIAAGSYWTRAGWSFWSVRYRDRHRAVTILLSDGRYRKIVVTIDDPDATVNDIHAAIDG